MGQILKLYTQITLLRRGPQDVPASMLLLALTVLAYVVVNFAVAALLPEQGAVTVNGETVRPATHFTGRLMADTLFLLLWYAVLLRLVGRPERFLQTAAAVFGLQTVLAPFLGGTDWLMRQFANDSAWQVPVAFLELIVVVWLIAANSQVVRAALQWSGIACVALVILQIVGEQLLQLALFPAARS